MRPYCLQKDKLLDFADLVIYSVKKEPHNWVLLVLRYWVHGTIGLGARMW